MKPPEEVVVPFLLAGGDPNWKPRLPVVHLRRLVLVSSDEQVPYKRASKDPRSNARSRAHKSIAKDEFEEEEK